MELVLFDTIEDIPGEVDVCLFQHVECALSPVNTDVVRLNNIVVSLASIFFGHRIFVVKKGEITLIFMSHILFLPVDLLGESPTVLDDGGGFDRAHFKRFKVLFKSGV